MQIADKKQLEEYSTSEQVVGTWIDGKPVYELVYKHNGTLTATSTFTSSTLTSVSSLNIDSLITLTGTLLYGATVEYVPYTANASSGYYSFHYLLSNGNIVLQHIAGSSNTLSNIIVVMRYTKTTD